jgi:hypothetical protein
MVAAGIAAGDRAAGKSANAVRRQPLIAAGALPAAASVSAKDQERDLFIKVRPAGMMSARCLRYERKLLGMVNGTHRKIHI